MTPKQLRPTDEKGMLLVEEIVLHLIALQWQTRSGWTLDVDENAGRHGYRASRTRRSSAQARHAAHTHTVRRGYDDRDTLHSLVAMPFAGWCPLQHAAIVTLLADESCLSLAAAAHHRSSKVHVNRAFCPDQPLDDGPK